MTFTSHSQLADALMGPLAEAARTILAARDKGLVVERKSDGSQVTEADRQAEEILAGSLKTICPGIPIIAEESAAAGSVPAIGQTFFLLDPLDGTRDYCAGNDDFTINIGLVDNGRPVFGLILAPARHELFVTPVEGEAIFAAFDAAAAPKRLADLGAQVLHVRSGKAGDLSALVSRREAGADFDDRLAQLGVTSRTAASSAVKFGLLARGDADIYPRFGPTCEWDTAAGHAIVEAAGGTVTALDGTPLLYGKTSSGFLNAPFVARGRIDL